jgi:DNA-binding FadR family transcriptional regulator
VNYHQGRLDAGQFFSNPLVVETVFQFHQDMVNAIRKKDAVQAAAIMRDMLVHGEAHLKNMIEQDRQSMEDQ